MARRFGAAGLLVVAFILGGCASFGSGTIAMPTPSPGDTDEEIMSVTGAGFTICGVSSDADFDLPATGGSDRYDVVVCGDMAKAGAALQARYPDLAAVSDLRPYQPDDGGRHSPQALVMQFWIMRTTGPGFKVTESEILSDDMIDVGVDGNLKAAQAALDKEFPGHVKVHSQAPGVELVGPKVSPPAE